MDLRHPISPLALPDGSPLDHLGKAYTTAGELDEIADHLVDHLVDHFVDRARDAGASWTQIGQAGSLAVEAIEATAAAHAVEQATMARRPAPSQEVPDKIPFTDDARKLLKLALRKAFQLGYNEVGPEHLLLALHSAPDGLAAQVLAAHELTPDRVDAEVRRLIGRDRTQPTA